MNESAPRFQFSLADVFAATVSLAYPAALVSRIDLEELDRPEMVAVVVGFGLLLGFVLAIRYRKLWDSRSPWFVPPFLFFFWSLFLMPYSGWPFHDWQSTLMFGYAPVFCSIAIGMRNQKKGGRYPLIAGAGGFLLGFLLSGLFVPPMVTSRRTVNEWSAPAALKSLSEAQQIYNRNDYDKDGIREYSATMHGLYETKPGAADLVFIDPAMAEADASLPSPQPKAGYLFRLLTAQNANQPIGTKPWFDAKGNLVGGYAFVAFPAQYRRSGRNTFLISSLGDIYQKDLGPQTESIVKAMTSFDLDSSWKNMSE